MISTIFQTTYWLNSVGPNVAAVVPCGILTFVWSRTKFWPLDFLHVKIDHLIRSHKRHADAINRVEKGLTQLHESHIALHRKVDGLVK